MYTTDSALLPNLTDFTILMASSALLMKTRITKEPAMMCTIWPLQWLKLAHHPPPLVHLPLTHSFLLSPSL